MVIHLQELFGFLFMSLICPLGRKFMVYQHHMTIYGILLVFLRLVCLEPVLVLFLLRTHGRAHSSVFCSGKL